MLEEGGALAKRLRLFTARGGSALFDAAFAADDVLTALLLDDSRSAAASPWG